VDTPGYHRDRTKLGDYMVNTVRDSIADVDATILVVEPIASVGPQEEGLIEKIRASKRPAILVINKIDTVEKEALLEVIAVYSQAMEFAAIIPICAKNGDGVDALLAECTKYAVEGPFLFDEDLTTDQPERQVMAEIIREKILWNLDREIPHGTAVEITRFTERDNGIIDIDATIYCEKASHKGIIIGKGGAMLKKISTMARTDCEKFMGTKVYLTTWVKVKENWRDSDFLVRNFGYSE
jgi:GTP-binding protein Era